MAVGGNGEVLLQCYNFGCGKTFNPETITDTSCCFHPGAPVFHDALKGWSCCRKRTTDFTEFMNIPGCTRGRCSNVKPEVPVKEVAEAMVPEVVNKPIEKPEVRPSIDEERKVMKIVTKSSYNQKKVDAKVVDVVSDEIKIGTTCFNKGCTKEYTNTEADNRVCVHHPGQVVFHDGLKFWSCCKRKTTDFNAFLQQKGCTNGRCKWERDASEVEKVSCRHDWHQTGNYVTLSIYAKLANALTSTFKLNQISVECGVTFDGGKRYDVAFELDGVVDVQESKVTISGTKVEVQMRKKRIRTWKEFATEIEEEEKDVGGEECGGGESCGGGGEVEETEGKKAEEDFKDADDQYYDVAEDDFDDIDTIEFD